MTEDVKSVKKPTELDTWCWKQKGHTLSNEELFSFARKIGRQSEMKRDDIEQSLEKASSEESQNMSENAQRRLDEYTEKQIADAFHKAASKGTGGTGMKDASANESNPSSAEKSGGEEDTNSLQQLAQSILSELGSGFSDNSRLELMDELKWITRAEHLLEFIKQIEREWKSDAQKGQGHGSDEKHFSAPL